MRDLIEDPHPAYTARMMADLTSDGTLPGLRGGLDGKVGPGRSVVHAGAGEGQGRAPGEVSRIAVDLTTDSGISTQSSESSHD